MLSPDFTGYKVKMVKIQQQTDAHSCGLYACYTTELLSRGRDPLQVIFDQLHMRRCFRYFLETDYIDEHHATDVTTLIVHSIKSISLT